MMGRIIYLVFKVVAMKLFHFCISDYRRRDNVTHMSQGCPGNVPQLSGKFSFRRYQLVLEIQFDVTAR